MGDGFRRNFSGLAQRLGLGFVALTLMAAPIGSVSHAAAPESSHHAAAAALAQAAGSPCDAQHGGDAGTPAGSECCLSFCHVAAGPLSPPPGAALPHDFPDVTRLGPADGHLPDGLHLRPPPGPPRTDA
jgi:hypothetical protein